ncbi:hypothetical protein [Anaerorhabdus furcosa]|uniref:Uncharacterized protein n=1 Tax=Anaerorhabdus furcosa TaxID=118967 RepID=A0A1T4LS22_9FIRM|nr:hypothetical protein [Anaerorhabdus furcosa]SJZ57447.1 hypothetical protein SAMN02745191_1014 [Anaerorhabdus furcosa]
MVLGKVLVNGNDSPFPAGFKFEFGEHPTLKGSGTINYDNSKLIPLVITLENGLANDWSGNAQTHLYKTLNGKNIQYLYCQPRTSYSLGYVSITNYTGLTIDLIRHSGGFDNLQKRTNIVTNFSCICTMWLEKK